MYILIILLSIASAFACQNDAIRIVRRSGVSINSNGNNSGTATQKVNMPVLFNGKWGCWEQEGGLSFDVKEKKRSMTIIVPKSKFEGIPGRAASYAYLRKDAAGSIDIDIATFVCIGSTVIAAETFSGDIAQARMLQSIDGEVRTVFATGAAAAELNRQRSEMARRLGRTNELPGGIQEYFEENFKGDWSELEKYDLMVPSVFLSTSMKSPLANLSSSYNTRVLTKSACSPEFERVMAPLKFGQLSIPTGMKAKIKKGNLLISW